MEKTTLADLHSEVARYIMPDRAKDLILAKDLVLLCGVTASGKNTIANYLVKHAGYGHVISHTTRSPRVNMGVLEEDGREYWFVDNSQMLNLVKQKSFIEIKAVHGDTCYGTSIDSVEAVLAKGLKPVMEIDVQGALELTQVVLGLRPIFVLPPSYEVWMQRLSTRGALSEDDISRRIRSASMELRTAMDHPAFLLQVNHEVEFTAVEIIDGISENPENQAKNRELAERLLAEIGGK